MMVPWLISRAHWPVQSLQPLFSTSRLTFHRSCSLQTPCTRRATTDPPKTRHGVPSTRQRRQAYHSSHDCWWKDWNGRREHRGWRRGDTYERLVMVIFESRPVRRAWSFDDDRTLPASTKGSDGTYLARIPMSRTKCVVLYPTMYPTRLQG